MQACLAVDLSPTKFSEKIFDWGVEVYKVKVSLILDLVNPVETPPWHCDNQIRLEDVLSAIDRQDFLATPVPDADIKNANSHIRRIAWLVKNGWSDPIDIDVGIPGLGLHIDWPVTDGNHRLYAAIVREDLDIWAYISGSIDYANEILEINDENSRISKIHP